MLRLTFVWLCAPMLRLTFDTMVNFCLVLRAYAALDFCHYRRLPSTYTRAHLLLGVCGSHNLQRERAVVT